MGLGQLVSPRLGDRARAQHKVNLVERVAVTLEYPQLSPLQCEDVVTRWLICRLRSAVGDGSQERINAEEPGAASTASPDCA